MRLARQGLRVPWDCKEQLERWDLPVQQGQRAQRAQLDPRVPRALQDLVLMADRISRPPALSSCRLASTGSVWNSMAPVEAEPLSRAMGEAAEIGLPIPRLYRQKWCMNS